MNARTMTGFAMPCSPASTSSCRLIPSPPTKTTARRVAELTEFAHHYGVAVEAEVGHLPSGNAGTRNGHYLTDPELAARFLQETDVDLLAVSVAMFTS